MSKQINKKKISKIFLAIQTNYHSVLAGALLLTPDDPNAACIAALLPLPLFSLPFSIVLNEFIFNDICESEEKNFLQ